MNMEITVVRRLVRSFCFFPVMAAAIIVVATAQARPNIFLADGNSVAEIDPSTQAGMSGWSVEGQNQLFQQWFWYRIGQNPEASIDTIGVPAILQPTARQASILYTSPLFSVQVDYLLTGGTPLSGRSDITESIRIINRSATFLDFHFFQYSDFDLGGSGNDTVQLGKNLAGRFNEAVISDPLVAFTETVTVPGANHGEASFFNGTLLALNDGFPTTLNDNAGPVGPGDVTWAFQWDFNIAPGGSVLISKDKYLELTVIPEPRATLVSLFAAGVLSVARAHRNRKN